MSSGETTEAAAATTPVPVPVPVQQQHSQPGPASAAMTEDAPPPPVSSTVGLDVEAEQQQQRSPPPPPIAKDEPAPAPPVPSTRKRPSKHTSPPKPILRPPGSSHTASHNPLITGVAAAASLLPTNAKPALASFLHNINTRLAQGGVGVQVPIPHALTPTPGGANIPGQGLSYAQQQHHSSSAGHQQGSQQYSGYGSIGSPPPSSSSQSGSGASALLNGVLRRFSGAGPSTSGSGAGGSGTSTPTRGDPYSGTNSRAPSASFGSTTHNNGSRSPTDFRPSSPSLSSSQQQQQPSIRPLRRVQFRPTLMAVTYPIVNTIAPADEDATRRRVEAEHRAHLLEIYGDSSSSSAQGAGAAKKKRKMKKVWTIDEVEDLYTRCCRVRQEWPLKKMRQVFQDARQLAGNGGGAGGAAAAVPLKTLDLSTIPLDQDAVDPLADFLSVDFGLEKLVLENCMLTDECLKAILHALLVSGTLPNLSLASNKKIKPQGWKYVALFVRRAAALRYLDLSENSLNKAALAEIVGALERAPRALVSPADERRARKETPGNWGGEGSEGGDREGDGGVEEGDGAPELQPLLDEIPLMPVAPLLRSHDASSISSSLLSSSSPTTTAATQHYSQLTSLRLENCALKISSLETLAQGVRASDLRHLSLRRNKISNAGASALALVLKDYPDVVASSSSSSGAGASAGAGYSDGMVGLGLGAGAGDGLEAQPMAYTVRSSSGAGAGPLAASGKGNQANVVSASGGGAGAAVRKDPRRTSYLHSPTESSASSLLSLDTQSGSGSGSGGTSTTTTTTTTLYESPILPQVPDIISSPQGGVTSKRMNTAGFGGAGAGAAAAGMPNGGPRGAAERGPERAMTEGDPRSPNRHPQGYHATTAATPGGYANAAFDPASLAAEQALAAAKAQRAYLANLPRVGALLTLDLKSNDIGSGAYYLAQALKKNRTLRVLNLSDCNIDMAGLIAMADMLKYNGTLETLDLSHNQCCGPSLEGISTLRTAFTLNSGLKRLFLSDTDLSSEGAICLAEFLPEAKSLIHLDLTENYDIDIAGVMALSVSLRMNTSLRCLDLNVRPNNPEFSRLSQQILQSCIRNTEEAQRRATQRGVKQPVAAPIYRSAVARAAKAEDAQREAEAEDVARAAEGVRVRREKKVRDTLEAAQECAKVLGDLLVDGPGAGLGRPLGGGGTVESGETTAVGAGEGGAGAKESKVGGGGGGSGSGQGELLADLLGQSKRLRERLAVIASNMKDGKLLARTLYLHDELDRLATRAAALQSAPPPASPATSTLDSPFLSAPSQTDSGLSSPTFSIGSDDEDDEPASSERVEKNLRLASQSLASSSSSSARARAGNEDAEEEEEEEEEDLLSPRLSSVSSSSATRALPSLTIHVEGQEAEKVRPAEEEEAAAEEEVDAAGAGARSPVESRAKGQLSEEGEIFRKAKSLMLVEESGLGSEDEEGGQSVGEGGSAGALAAEVEGAGQAVEAATTPAALGASLPSMISERRRRTPSSDSTLSHSSAGSSNTATSATPSSNAVVVDFDPEVSGEALRREILEADVPRRVGRSGSIGSNGSASASNAAEGGNGA
ncbi:hypothetical protein V8E36_005193 [Tilletia maclaganii]